MNSSSILLIRIWILLRLALGDNQFSTCETCLCIDVKENNSIDISCRSTRQKCKIGMLALLMAGSRLHENLININIFISPYIFFHQGKTTLFPKTCLQVRATHSWCPLRKSPVAHFKVLSHYQTSFPCLKSGFFRVPSWGPLTCLKAQRSSFSPTM